MAGPGPKIQNFSIPAGEPVQVNFDVNPDSSIVLLGASLYWKIYEQKFGVPVGDAIITKTIDNGMQIDDPDALLFHASLLRADTKGLLGGYYHECTVVDRNGGYFQVTIGIMTVTLAKGASDIT